MLGSKNLKWMQFIDGENLSMAAQRVASAQQRHLAGDYHRRDSLFWVPGKNGNASLSGEGPGPIIEPYAIRSHYYTSTTGGEDVMAELRSQLRKLGFQPYVFKRDKGTRRSKGVDIALATDMLGHAFRGNYEAAVLVAGDGDYLPLITEVQRLGKWVWVQFFEHDSSDQLRLAADRFNDLTKIMDRFARIDSAPPLP